MTATREPDALERALGIDPNDPASQRAARLVGADVALLRELSAERRRRGLGVAEVARLLGWQTGQVRAFEAYDADPRLSEIRRYAQAIGVTLAHEVEGTPVNAEG